MLRGILRFLQSSKMVIQTVATCECGSRLQQPKSLHAVGISSDCLIGFQYQIYNLSRYSGATATRANNYGETKMEHTQLSTLFKTRTFGTYQGKYGGAFLMNCSTSWIVFKSLLVTRLLTTSHSATGLNGTK